MNSPMVPSPIHAIFMAGRLVRRPGSHGQVRALTGRPNVALGRPSRVARGCGLGSSPWLRVSRSGGTLFRWMDKLSDEDVTAVPLAEPGTELADLDEYVDATSPKRGA